ncbi:hypothetical protein NQ317_018178 [Molorchus minor]|uniref:Uncharacterized protein n=1 Tax=Molorchus minor TaxID=1323400 RepID=A0ABQ9JY32_9CUCU|nr:hypothetical protein NQ317_018178 [Molorchus minor]
MSKVHFLNVSVYLVSVKMVIVQSAAIISPLHTAIMESDYDPNPQYTFGYDVNDPFTGDSKSQVESRSGDVVHGSYSLNDPDGTRRIVDYTADPINGFNAVVRRTPLIHTANVVAPGISPVAPEVTQYGIKPIGPTSYSVLPLAYSLGPLDYRYVDSHYKAVKYI